MGKKSYVALLIVALLTCLKYARLLRVAELRTATKHISLSSVGHA